MFMLGTGFFFFCFLIAIGYFLYKYFSHFGVNILFHHTLCYNVCGGL